MSSSDARIVCVRSASTAIFSDGGSDASSSGSLARILSTVETVFAPGFL